MAAATTTVNCAPSSSKALAAVLAFLMELLASFSADGVRPTDGALAVPRGVAPAAPPPAAAALLRQRDDEPLTCFEAWLRCRSDVTCRVLIDVFTQACDESGQLTFRTYLGVFFSAREGGRHAAQA